MTALRAKDFYPYEYLLRIRPVHCTNCRQGHSSSELMLVRVHSGLGAGSAARQLTPVDELKGDLPISTTLLPPRRVGVCHLCIATHPAASRPAVRPPISEFAWAQALKADAQARRSEAKSDPAKIVARSLPADLSDIP
jgi:hypothetical protein